MAEGQRLYINYVDDTVRKAQADIFSPLPPVVEYPGEAMAFGDGENDIEMLDYVGLGWPWATPPPR